MMSRPAAARPEPRARRRGLVRLALVAGLAGPAAQGPPLETAIGASAVTEAVRLGLSGDARALDRFHAPYRHLAGGPFLQSLELITEFRCVVLSAERAAQAGGSWDARRAERALEPYRGLVTLVVHVRFNPQNTYRTMPRLEAAMYPRAGGKVLPVDQRARPSFLSGPAPPGTPVLEGTLEADFLASALDPRGHPLVGIFLEGREIERTPIDLSAIR